MYVVKCREQILKNGECGYSCIKTGGKASLQTIFWRREEKGGLYYFFKGRTDFRCFSWNDLSVTQKMVFCRSEVVSRELSNSTGLCLKTINRSVKKLSEQGLITKEGNKILVDQSQYERLKRNHFQNRNFGIKGKEVKR